LEPFAIETGRSKFVSQYAQYKKSLFNPLWLSSIEKMKHVFVVKELRIKKENSGTSVRRLSDAIGIYTNLV